MIFGEIIQLALSSLRANKLRSSLTVLGIAIGVFSVIGVMTFIAAARGQLESGLSILGANSFQIQKFPAINFSNPWLKYGNRRDMTLQMSERFRELMGDTAKVNAQIDRRGLIASYLDRRTTPNTKLVGTDEYYFTSFNYTVVTGRNLGAEDVSLGRAVCVLGDEVTQKLFPGETAVGHLVKLGGQTYTVIGTVAPKGTSFGDSQDNFVVIPITRWFAVHGRAGRSITLNVQAPSQAALSSVQDKAIGAMRLTRGLDPEDENDFEVFTNDSLIEMFNGIMNVVTLASFGISGIALIAAGIGVMNIMLVSVTERTKEIGIRKSIGARKNHILAQFLMEAVALSLIGGLAGVGLGVGIGSFLAMQMGITVAFPWFWAAGGMAVCGGIGVIFGLYPAWKAASLDPIEALRYE